MIFTDSTAKARVAVCAAFILALGLGLASAGETIIITDPALITINDNSTASTYPLTTTVPAGFFNPQIVTRVQVQLNGFAHTYPDDVDMILVGPGGQRAMIMSDAGGETDVTGLSLRFSSVARPALPDAGPLVTGLFRPANYDTDADTFPAPFPPPGALTGEATDLSVFNLTNPVGTWSLYIVDDAAQDAGSIAEGWSLILTIPVVFTVNSTADTTDGVCNAANCTLREAITLAGDGDLINFAPLFNTPQTINLLTALPDIDNSVTIQGPGANLLTVRRAFNATTDFRIFNIADLVSNVAISGMTITGGRTSNFGGGIHSFSNLTLTDVHLTGNHAESSAGGGVALGFAHGVFTGCTFSNNTATEGGGGINFQGNGNHTLRLINSTVSGNSGGDLGGGIRNFSNGTNSRLEVTNSTIANNTSATGGGLLTYISGNAGNTATTTLRNTIIANNTPTNLATGTSSGATPTITSLGFNLTNDPTNPFLNQPTDKLNAVAGLAPLAINGGTTPVHVLLGSSAALDAGNSSGATTDQRGVARAFDTPGIPNAPDFADIGAVEMRSIFVTNANDANAGSLRQAITDANANPALNDIIFNTVFNAPQTINLLSALPALTDSVTINGTGVITVRRNDGATNFRIFHIPGGGLNIAFSGITISNGNAPGTDINGHGGAILSFSDLALTNVAVTGNTAGRTGGAVRLTGANGIFTNSLFSNNTAGNSGGGISFESSGRRLRIVNSTVSGNTANGGGSGGGIFQFTTGGNNTLEVVGSTIFNNTGNDGGGIRVGASGATTIITVTLRNSIISNNTPTNLLAATSGGGTATITSQGFNLTNDPTNVFLNQTTDKLNAFAGLATLANNGGATPTHALLGSSAALDAGHSSGAKADQRGSLRPVDLPVANQTGGDGADIGAFEAQTTPATPTFIINDVTQNELNSGTSNFNFTVSLSAANAQPVSVSFVTANDTATAPSDYTAVNTTVMTFNPGEINKGISISVVGDTILEPNETFFINLTNPSAGVTIADNQGLGTIVNDDVPSQTVTNLDDASAGSLRQVIASAPNGSTVILQPGLNGAITLTTGQIVINKNLTINAPGANLLTVSGNNQSRVFRVGFGFIVSLNGMTITGGNGVGAVLSGSGGGILNEGILTISNSIVTGNTAADFGGGINNRTDLTVIDSTVSGNTAANGGGIASAFAPVNLTRSTVTGNIASALGGGLNSQGGNAVLTNSTISGNRANGASGGGVVFGSFGGSFTLQVTGCTIANNHAGTNAGGIFTFAQGEGNSATTVLRNTLIADNTPSNLATQPGGGAATFTSQGYNLTSDSCGCFVPGTGDKIGQNPLLAPLSLIGGTTPTHALLGGSPALDAGDASGLSSDQRGVARGFDTPGSPNSPDFSDIGAVEMRSIIVTTNADSGAGSLRHAITTANTNANGAGLDDIIFDNTVFNTAQTINLLTALSDITGSVTLSAAGANLLTVRRDNAAADFRIFNIPGGVPNGVAISGMTVTGGRAPVDFGGGIFSQSNLTLTNVHVTGNQATNGIGGGVALAFADGVFTGCTFSSNTVTNGGGGIFYEGDGGHTLRLVNSTVSGNSANDGGGIINASFGGNSRLEVTNSTVANNNAGNSGIRTFANGAGTSATTTLRNTIIAGNTPNNLSTGANNGGAATFQTLGFNLSDNFNGVLTPLATDITAQPLLAPLSLNGGTTPTHAFASLSSMAIDRGDRSGSTTDQRGSGRPFDNPNIPNGASVDGADIGAFEQRASLVVNVLGEGNGDNICNADCSLREAISAATSSDTVFFASPLFDTPQTITLTSFAGELGINKNLAIQGPGANLLTVSGNNTRRVFNIGAGFNVAISGLRVTGGRPPNNESGGGILSRGNLSLSKCAISGNTTQGAGGGGGIYSEGGSSTVADCTISGNTSNGGGGISAFTGTVDITRSTINGNNAAFNGGGLNLASVNGSLTNTTISGNTDGNGGGGVAFLSFGGSFTLQVTNCTIASNTSPANAGGGISTIGQGAAASATTLLRNTIIADNTLPNLLTSNGGGGAAAIMSQGFNLASDGGGGFLNLAPITTDKTGANAGLAALANNGGATPTHALLFGSAALDAGNNTGSGQTTDQRGAGFPRPVDLGFANAAGSDGTDIGALEMAGGPLTLTSIVRLPNGHILLQGWSEPGSAVTIQAAPDPNAASFSNLTPPAAADTTGFWQHDDAGAIGQTKRFYRATLP